VDLEALSPVIPSEADAESRSSKARQRIVSE
jgi:hypothetical protein